MILYLNTAEKSNVTIAVIGRNKIVRLASRSDYDLSVKFLGLIQTATKRAKAKFADLEAIAVVKGPGFFSRLRTSIVTANALAFVLGLQIIPLSPDDKIDYSSLLRKKRLTQVLPRYGT